MEQQLFSAGQKGWLGKSWLNAIEKVDVYLDRGMTKEMHSLCNTLLEQGKEIELSTIMTHDFDRVGVLKDINKNCSGKEALDIAMDITESSLAKGIAMEIEHEDLELIAALNGHSYKSRERKFELEPVM
jgi:hypothetical protein